MSNSKLSFPVRICYAIKDDNGPVAVDITIRDHTGKGVKLGRIGDDTLTPYFTKVYSPRELHEEVVEFVIEADAASRIRIDVTASPARSMDNTDNTDYVVNQRLRENRYSVYHQVLNEPFFLSIQSFVINGTVVDPSSACYSPVMHASTFIDSVTDPLVKKTLEDSVNGKNGGYFGWHGKILYDVVLAFDKKSVSQKLTMVDDVLCRKPRAAFIDTDKRNKWDSQ